ncbi:hypothetical protein GWI33_016049 [Rhynchophorus ferrugineus]|uniref:2-(3-amino-3-carboxypropyl)histidine synthase n=1 Tax=Rhynchophorus ferrugineus TaxID=354439 RepID=A0A834M3R6_RHYFE|nr:hypothetical protein GWI33_016049 [Rhynchophorus ferrugineus]
MPQFFTDDSVTLEKQIDLTDKFIQTHEGDLNKIYDIDKCCQWIQSNKFKKVCLQFPDYLLADSTEVATCIQEKLGQTVYILGDTAYESCCIDYVAAAHINADAIIHYGVVCFSKPLNDIPYLYVYEKHNINLEELNTALSEFSIDKELVVLLLDTEFIYKIDEINTIVSKRNNIQVQRVDNDLLDLDDKIVVYAGSNLKKLENFNLIFKAKYFNILNRDKESYEITKYEIDPKIIKKRSYLIEKIRDAQTFGIVIGTVGVKNYMNVINRLKKLIELNNKKYYLISVGKPTIAKLANFLEIDIYIMITCSLNDIFDSRDYYKPLFSYDYNTYINTVQDINVISNTDVSLVTGKMRPHFSTMENILDTSKQNQVAVKEEGTVALNTNYGAGFLHERSWKGLEQNLGQTEAALVQDGRKGVAQSYQDELA